MQGCFRQNPVQLSMSEVLRDKEAGVHRYLTEELSMILTYKRVLEIGVTLAFVAWLVLLFRWLLA
jgi:hypothetical protein